MYTRWTQHLKDDPKAKEAFEGHVRNSVHVLNRQKAILDEMEADLNVAEVSPKNYEIPNWDYRQAHNNGYRQAIQVIRKLIDLDQQKDNTNEFTRR